MTRSKGLQAVVSCLVAAALIADIGLLYRAYRESKQMGMLLDGAILRDPEVRLIGAPHGLSASLNPLVNIVQAGRPWVLRYAAQSCVFCRQDSDWYRLAGNLRRAGIPIVVLLPSPDEHFEERELSIQGATELALIAMEWMKPLRLTLTPTVAMIGAGGEVVWQRQGVLTADDVAAALSALQLASGGVE